MLNYERSFEEDYKRLVSECASRVFIHDSYSEEDFTYDHIDQLADECWKALGSQGVQSVSILASVLPDSLCSLITFMSCLKYGIDYMPLSSQITVTELKRYLFLVKPSYIVVLKGAKQKEVVQAAGYGAQVIELDIADWRGKVQGLRQTTQIGVRRNSLLYVSTSGSTGAPKCLKLETDRLWAAGCAFSSFHEFLDDSTIFYNFYPMCYLAGLFNLTLIPMSVGARVVLGEGFTGLSMMRFWTIVKRYGVNVLWFSPTVLHGLLACSKTPDQLCPVDLATTIRAGFLGMGPISKVQKLNYERILGFPLLENYALSETTFLTSETLSNRFRRSEGSVGEILPWVDARVVAETGEIENRTPFLCKGEIVLEEGNPIEHAFDRETFWKTGDLGRIVGKLLYYAGRLKHLVKRGGYLVSLDELEGYLSEVQGAEGGMVLGVEHPFYGESTVICLRKPQREVSGMIRQHLAEKLSRYKWPSYFAFLDEFPLTVTGKPDRKGIERLLIGMAKDELLELF